MSTGRIAVLLVSLVMAASGASRAQAAADRAMPTPTEIMDRCSLIARHRDPDQAAGLRLAQARLTELLDAATNPKTVWATIKPACGSLLVPGPKVESGWTWSPELQPEHAAPQWPQWSFNLGSLKDWARLPPSWTQRGELAEEFRSGQDWGPAHGHRGGSLLGPGESAGSDDWWNRTRTPSAQGKDGRRDAAIEPFFPWPPPAPFLSEVRPRSAFPARVTDLGRISALLTTDLQQAGYSDMRFFSVRDDGFAMVTPLERIDSHQHPLAGTARWDQSGGVALDVSSFSIRDYLLALFHRRSGQFRVFALIVTPQNVVPDRDRRLLSTTVLAWQERGALGLPDTLAHLPFSDQYKVYVLIYEFRKQEGDLPEALTEGTAAEHLAAAGIKLTAVP